MSNTGARTRRPKAIPLLSIIAVLSACLLAANIAAAAESSGARILAARLPATAARLDLGGARIYAGGSLGAMVPAGTASPSN